MKERLLYLLKSYALTVAVFLVAKVAFMLLCREGHAFSAGDVWDVLMHGLSLDLSTALYLICLPFLLLIVNVWFTGGNWLIYSQRVTHLLIAFGVALAFVADTSLYPFWKFKLDASCLQYLDTPTEAMASVTTGYLLVRLLVLVLLTAVLTWAYWLCLPKAKSGSRKQKVAETLLYIALIPLLIIGMRGGLSESTTNIGQVYFSQNQFLNHAAVNPVFSFLSSMGKSGTYIVSYDYYSDEECATLTDGLFTTESNQPEALLKTTRPNVIIILMESCGGQFTMLGGRPDITPRLTQLAEEGIFFTECYANSWRTDKGVVSALSGYPAFPITSIMKIPEKSRKLPSIAASLVGEGYATNFFYGGDINFTNMHSYLMETGYERVVWKADYPRGQQQSAQWGVRDDLMFASLLDDIRREQSPRWMKTILTLSSHEPWDVPRQAEQGEWNQEGDEVYNAFHYMDGCIGAFIDSLRQMPAWDDLLVVLLPDHGYRYKDIDETTRIYNHIPMIWVGGAVDGPRRISRICNQSDLAATLLGQMQVDHGAFTFSRDVVSRDYQRAVAWHTYNNGVSLFDSTGFMVYDLDVDQMIVHEGHHAEDQLRLARALLQLTSHDFKEK